jgi:hypothetical protein
MESSEKNNMGSNPLYKNKVAAVPTEAPVGVEKIREAPLTTGTGSNNSLATDGPLRQTINEDENLTNNDDAPEDEDPADDLGPDDDAEELFDDDFEVDGDSLDLNADIDDDDLDTLDGPLLDENNPRH